MRSIIFPLLIIFAFALPSVGQSEVSLQDLQTLRKTGNCQRVFEMTKTPIDDGNTEPSIYLERAKCFIGDNRDKEAKDEVLKALASPKVDARLYWEGCDQILVKLDRELSTRIATKFIDAKRFTSQAYQIRSRNQALNGKYKESLEDIVKALQTRDDADMFNMMGFIVTLERTKNTLDAMNYYEFIFDKTLPISQALSDQIKNPDITNPQWVSSGVQLKDANAILMATIQAWVHHCDTRGLVGCRNEGLEKMASIPTPLVYSLRADFYRKHGMPAEAETNVRLFKIARINELTGRMQLHIFEYAKASNLYLRGQLYLGIDDMEKAVVDFQEALKLDAQLAEKINKTLAEYKAKLTK